MNEEGVHCRYMDLFQCYHAALTSARPCAKKNPFQIAVCTPPNICFSFFLLFGFNIFFSIHLFASRRTHFVTLKYLPRKKAQLLHINYFCLSLVTNGTASGSANQHHCVLQTECLGDRSCFLLLLLLLLLLQGKSCPQSSRNVQID